MSGTTTPIGDFAVVGGSHEADAFRAAIGLPRGGETLPLTFPMRWLADPAVRAAMAALLPETDLVPVHESQSFDYATPLRVDTGYALRLAARREAEPARIVVAGTILDAAGARVATTETVLRLFSIEAAA